MRIVHLFVIGALVFAAAYVYRIKMESTVRTERVMKLRADIRERARRDRRAACRMGQARCAGAAAGPGRAPSAAKPLDRHAIRHAEEPAANGRRASSSRAIPIRSAR